MLMAGLTSWRVARRRMRYETWWVTHLYLYLALALAFGHQVLFGEQFASHDWARWIWIGMYVVTLGTLLAFRVGLPVYRSLRHDLRVHAVVRESADTVSVWLRGRDLDAMAIRGGQFFGWRFLTPQTWWDSHPYSLSAGADARYLRITVKDLGDHSRSLASLRPGTRVVAEGPYGVFTADSRHSERVVLLAGGTGIAPIRALLDDLPAGVRIDLLFRAPRTEALVLRTELEAIAATRPGMRVRYLVGHRRDYPIDARTLLHLVPDVQSADVFVCGPRSSPTPYGPRPTSSGCRRTACTTRRSRSSRPTPTPPSPGRTPDEARTDRRYRHGRGSGRRPRAQPRRGRHHDGCRRPTGVGELSRRRRVVELGLRHPDGDRHCGRRRPRLRTPSRCRPRWRAGASWTSRPCRCRRTTDAAR